MTQPVFVLRRDLTNHYEVLASCKLHFPENRSTHEETLSLPLIKGRAVCAVITHSLAGEWLLPSPSRIFQFRRQVAYWGVNYSSSSGKWTKFEDGGQDRFSIGAVAVDNDIYAFGGWNKNDSQEVKNGNIRVFVLNADSRGWKQIQTDGEVPFQRFGHTVVAWNGKVYLWGGNGDCSNMNEFDPATRTWTVLDEVSGEVPSGRSGHSGVVVGDKLYILGGGKTPQEQYCYNFRTYVWTRIADYVTNRCDHTAVALNDQIYVFGGDENDADKLEVFDPETGQWSVPDVQGEIPSRRFTHSTWTYNGKMYVLGGYQQGGKYFDDLREFDPEKNTWKKLTPAGDAPPPLIQHSSICVGDKVFVFGGIVSYGYFKDGNSDLYVLDFKGTEEKESVGGSNGKNIMKFLRSFR